MNLKHDAHLFKQTLQNLKTQDWLGPSRRWWPDYVFHFTDVCNAASVLKNEAIYSRSYLDKNDGMKTENASPDVIEQTATIYKEFVRFYFRPKTPTQYNNEGFRPTSERALGGAHCPVPIFFLFKSEPLLCMKDSMFSYGSLAVQCPTVYKNGTDFMNMPFEYIYHEGRYDPLRESYIKFNRHAELIIPEKCGLEHLELIVCRSHAERETLLHLLPYDKRVQWKDKIILDTRLNLYFNYWTFIDKVTLTEQSISFSFNKGSYVFGNFKAHLIINEKMTGKTHSWSNDNFRPQEVLTIDLKSLTHPEHYSAKFYLDKQLAFGSHYYNKESLPF